VKAAALRSGAGVCAISGSGPSLFAAVADPRSARRVAAVMVAAWKRRGIEAEAHVSRIGAAGARVIA
jgi:homoserine kinase